MALLLLLLLALCIVFVDCRFVYVGTGGSNGIHVYKQNTNGTLQSVSSVKATNAGFLAVHPNGQFLYGTGDGTYVSYTIHADGSLVQINSQPSGGSGPTHTSVHPDGKYLFGANYVGGNFVSFPLGLKGEILPRADLKMPGSAMWVVPDRQEAPHAHMIITAPNKTQVVGIDLGADKIFVFSIDANTGKLNTNGVPYGQVASGNGCRHIAFHPNNKFAYVVAELANTIYSFVYNYTVGSFLGIQALSTIPDTFTEFTKAAEIRVHPNGLYVYVTNRGADSIAGYKIFSSGKLSFISFTPTRGGSPRGMNIDPSGQFLYVANEDGNNVVHYNVDIDTGLLIYVSEVNVADPMDVEFGL